MNPEEWIKKIQDKSFEEGEAKGCIRGKKEGLKEGIAKGYSKGLKIGSELVILESEDDTLKVLQMLALIKIEKYKAKWSKSSEDHIERLEEDFDNVEKLTVYFTKK